MHSVPSFRLRASFPVDLHVHRADPQALAAVNAFALIAVNAEQRKSTHELEEHRNGTEVFAERPVILEGKGQRNARNVVECVPGEEQSEHDLFQMRNFHQEKPGHQR